MARCPDCGKRFAVPEDEQDMHACPRCGYHPLGEPDSGEPPEDGWPGEYAPACPRCNGLGLIKVLPHPVEDCPVCHGTGEPTEDRHAD